MVQCAVPRQQEIKKRVGEKEGDQSRKTFTSAVASTFPPSGGPASASAWGGSTLPPGVALLPAALFTRCCLALAVAFVLDVEVLPGWLPTACLSFLAFIFRPDATGFGEEAVDLMWETDHVAASFLRDVGEVLVDDLRQFISFLPRLASCFEPLSILWVLPLLCFVEGSIGLVVVPFPRSVDNLSACPFVERSGKVV